MQGRTGARGAGFALAAVVLLATGSLPAWGASFRVDVTGILQSGPAGVVGESVDISVLYDTADFTAVAVFPDRSVAAYTPSAPLSVQAQGSVSGTLALAPIQEIGATDLSSFGSQGTQVVFENGVSGGSVAGGMIAVGPTFGTPLPQDFETLHDVLFPAINDPLVQENGGLWFVSAGDEFLGLGSQQFVISALPEPRAWTLLVLALGFAPWQRRS